MASTSPLKKATWHEGDKCLAPNPRDGVLLDATIHRLTTSSDNEDTAWVIFTHKEDEEEQEEEAIPVSKLAKPGLSHFTQEKPVFPGTVTDPRLCVPLQLSEAKEDRVPYTINRYLRDYQRDGIRFMYNNYIRSKGCILGDDMGLGKTVQVIGFLAGVLHKTGTWEDIENNRPQFLQSQASKRSKPAKVFLIVAPLSVLYNWKDELDTWGHFQCVVVHGLRKEEELARIKKGRIEIALTTYETLRLCLEQFNKIDWCAVVVDEAHKIKNPNSQISQAMKELTCKIRIGLTGTILQNNLEELWCVMDWAIPGCLGSLGHFKTRFSDPIEQGQRHSATKRALATGRKTVRGLVRRISPWFLRRTKALIKDQLPKKDDRVVYCSLTDFQQTVYQVVLDTEDVTLLLRSSEKCDCQSGRTRRSCCYKTNSEGVQIKAMYFSYLAILRKVANHVALLQSSSDTSKKQEKYVKAICTKVFQKFPDFVQRCKNEAFEALSDPMYSGKMKVLQKLLKHYLPKRDKILIFSLSTKLLDVLESYCMAEGLDFSRLDGSTSAKQRVQIVKDFNSSPHINLCLVSTMAGGLGLNFVGANVVVLFDPTWNPANDLQAIDRAYRIGQCRDVTVLRLISLGTVEEVIYLRQVYKQQLQSSVVGKESARRYFEAVQGHGIHKGELFGIKNLFRLQTQGTCLTRQILEREGQVEAGVMMTRTDSGEEKEQETKGPSDPGVSSSTFGPAPKEEPAKETRDGSEIPKGVLDFSSGSEEEEEQGQRKMSSNLNVHDPGRSGNATTSPGQTNVLQQRISRLLERVKENPDFGEEGLSSDAEESAFESDAEDQMMEGASNGKVESSKMANGAVAPQKVRKKTSDTFCSSDSTHERAGGVSLLKEQGRLGLKPCVEEKNTVNSLDKKKDSILKTTIPKQHCFKGYSDESEDFDLESKMSSKKDVLNSPDRGGHGGKGKKRPSASERTKARTKYTEDIETFTSSEDERTIPKQGQRSAAEVPGRQAGRTKSVSFTSLKSLSSPSSKEKNRNIDNILGGVQEVAYIHSNQRVVGGSKAEELISRAAVRDVFERKMYSQFPANHLLGDEESLPESLLDSQPPPATVTVHSPTVSHPATFTSKSVHHTKHTTFIIGETPKAIRRRQLEEMAEKFQFSSVHQFAQEVLNGSSAQRLTWLQEYYTSLNHPDLASTVRKNFPQPDSTQASSPSSAAPSSSTPAATEYPSDTRNPQKDSLKATKKSKYGKTNPELKSKHKSPQNNVPEKRPSRVPPSEGREPPKKKKVSQKNLVEDLSDIPSPESEEESVPIARGRNQTKRGSVSSPGAGGGLGVDGAGSSGLESREAAAFLNHTDRHIPSFSDLSHDRSSKASKATGQGRRETSQVPSTSSNHSFLTDLLGDISVLDDLLKPKPRSAQKRSNLKPSHNVPASETTPSPPRRTSKTDSSTETLTTQQARTPDRAAKGARKDFWDILNEGNEESLNRLTDLEEVQRVCVTKNLAARDRSPLEDNKSLWKTNEKFLWKK